MEIGEKILTLDKAYSALSTLKTALESLGVQHKIDFGSELRRLDVYKSHNLSSDSKKDAEDKKDLINPSHYQLVTKDGRKLDSIDFIQAILSDEEFKGFCKGNALKYLVRAEKKHKEPLVDYKKSRAFLNFLINHIENRPASTKN